MQERAVRKCSVWINAGVWFGVLMMLFGCAGSGSAQTSASVAEPPKAAAPVSPTFEVVSIKPSGPNSPRMIQWKGTDLYKALHEPLLTSVVLAFYSSKGFLTPGTRERIVNAPAWLKSELYDVVGKVMPDDVSAWQRQGPDLPMMQQMVRKALEERCRLEVHHAPRNVPVYDLVPRKGAPAMQAVDPNQPEPQNAIALPTGGKMVPIQQKGGRTVTYVAITMAEFTANISNFSARPIVDKTGLSGRYTFCAEPAGHGGASRGRPGRSLTVGSGNAGVQAGAVDGSAGHDRDRPR